MSGHQKACVDTAVQPPAPERGRLAVSWVTGTILRHSSLSPLIFAMSYGQSAHCLWCSANPNPWSSFAKAPFLAHAGQVAKFPLGKRKETAAGPALNLGSLRRQVTRRRGSWAEPGTFATAVRHARGNQRQKQNVPCEVKCIAGPGCTIGSEPREFYAREFGCPPDVLM
jgi:hypothetical protein